MYNFLYTDVVISSDLDTREDLDIRGWDLSGEPGPFCSISWSSSDGEGERFAEDTII